MKKKITALFLCVALAAIAIVGASLAYFTDTDNEDQHLCRGQRQDRPDRAGAWRGPYRPSVPSRRAEKAVTPIVGSAQGEKDAPAGYAHRQELRGQDGHRSGTPASPRRPISVPTIAIPAALDDGYETFNAGMNVLHFNFGNKVVDGNIYLHLRCVEWIWTHGNKWNYFETTMDGIQYNVYFADYYQACCRRCHHRAARSAACISTSPSISARMASASIAFGKEVDSGRGLGLAAASPAPCSP